MSTENQPFQLKNIYSRPFVEEVAAALTTTYPAFNTADFLQYVFGEEWPALELKQRIRHISHGLRRTLPPAYPDAVAILTRTVERMVAQEGERLTFTWTIFPDFVEVFGVENPDVSIPALEILTQLSSAEFAVRPYLLHYPERMYAQMLAWAKHPSPMVRRLATEGFRPRLPWGMGIPALKKNPSHAIPVLELLKNDPAETVRRSVANHLNDISKDHVDLALDLANAWWGHTPETDWVVRHACRGLLKKGNPQALRLFGFDAAQIGTQISDFNCDPTVCIGAVFHFSFNVLHTGAAPVSVRLEYAIDYITSTGKTSHKVFKISELKLAPEQTVTVAKHQRFTDFTTRKHYAGPHKIDILINGVVQASLGFEVLEGR